MTDSQTSMQMKTIQQTLQLPVLKILYKQSPTPVHKTIQSE